MDLGEVRTWGHGGWPRANIEKQYQVLLTQKETYLLEIYIYIYMSMIKFDFLTNEFNWICNKLDLYLIL